MLIGILGEAGSGKDTAGKFLVQEQGFYSLALADPIKVYCHWMFGWSAERLWGSSELRNQKDVNLPFVRCPSCGFTVYNLGPIDPKANSTQCGLCGSIRTPDEWFASLSPRYALQSLGDWARNLFQDAYVEFMLQRVHAVQNHGVDFDPLWDTLERLNIFEDRWDNGALGTPVPNVLVSDVRLKNEIEGIQKEGGKVYRIRRRVAADNTTSGIPQHNSEVEQREVADEDLDGVIENHGTLEDLYENLSTIAPA